MPLHGHAMKINIKGFEHHAINFHRQWVLPSTASISGKVCNVDDVCLARAGEDDPEYVPEHIWVASESASDDEVDMTDEDEDDSDEDEDEGEGRGRIYIPIMGE